MTNLKPIIFNTEMAKAIRDCRKTETRRVIVKLYDIEFEKSKKYPIIFSDFPKDLEFKNFQGYEKICALFYSKSKNRYYRSDDIKYKTGDKLWVREPAIVVNYISRFYSTKIDYQLKSNKKKQYRIDLPDRFFSNPKEWIINCKSVPNGCIKEMARTFLIVTSIRVERLQDITIGDMINEGIKINNTNSLIKEGMLNLSKLSSSKNLTAVEIAIKNSFVELWDCINKKRGFSYNKNPFVFVLQFKKLKGM